MSKPAPLFQPGDDVIFRGVRALVIGVMPLTILNKTQWLYRLDLSVEDRGSIIATEDELTFAREF